jgi:NAD+ kinase
MTKGALIVAHHERPEAAALSRVAARWLRDRGWTAWMTPTDAAAVGAPELAAGQPGDVDLALSLGGDGTMLRTVELASPHGADIIGVNVGLLGYLSEVEPAELTDALERYVASDFAIEERMMLSVTARASDAPEQTWRALNEAVIEKRESGHTVRLLVRLDGTPFTTYQTDGLIVATPTGSTAYSLSARGPVVSPRHRALVLTPVSPHMLFDRSLVLGPDESIEIEVIGHRSADLNIDGQRALTLTQGSVVTCVAAGQPARFVRFRPGRFHHILKAKFGLSDR